MESSKEFLKYLGEIFEHCLDSSVMLYKLLMAQISIGNAICIGNDYYIDTEKLTMTIFRPNLWTGRPMLIAAIALHARLCYFSYMCP